MSTTIQQEEPKDNIIRLPFKSHCLNNEEQYLKFFDFKKIFNYLKNKSFRKILMNDIKLFEDHFKPEVEIITDSNNSNELIFDILNIDQEFLEFIQWLEDNPNIKAFYLHQFRAFCGKRSASL